MITRAKLISRLIEGRWSSRIILLSLDFSGSRVLALLNSFCCPFVLLVDGNLEITWFVAAFRASPDTSVLLDPCIFPRIGVPRDSGRVFGAPSSRDISSRSTHTTLHDYHMISVFFFFCF